MPSDEQKVLKYMGLDIWRRIRVLRATPEAQGLSLPAIGEPLTDREIIAVYRSNEAQRGVPDKVADEAAEAQIIAIGSAKWMASGMQQVEMGHKFCASLLVSNVTTEVLENLQHPWPAFMIIVPDNLIYMWNDKKNEPTSVQRVLVMEIDNKHGSWAYIAWDNEMDLAIWRFGIQALKMIPVTDEATSMNLGDVPMVDMDHRAAILISRLIVTTCAALTMPEMRKEPKNPKAHQAWAKLKNDPRKMTTDMPALSFIIGNPVIIDFRDRVKEYSRTGKTAGSKLEVGTTVMGHFKAQHYGKGNKQVKTIYREAYYRGPEEGAMLLRSHVIKKDEDAKETGAPEPAALQQEGTGAGGSSSSADPVDQQ